ncbi:MAG: 4Fe-4S binding protein [Deltaproteobacteria bacterium]|nr:4Fe-4S binding protein [Deltaproteobacteria bacterium]
MANLIYLKDVVTLSLDEGKCTGCGMCLVVCPQEVLVRQNGKVWIGNRDACMECGACMRNCPFGAITVEAGVGCAAAVINTALGREGSCRCILERDEEKTGERLPLAGPGPGACY